MPRLPRWAPILGLLPLGASSGAAQDAVPRQPEFFQYEAEWRLIRAGTAEYRVDPQRLATGLKLFSTGLVARLIKIEDVYAASHAAGWCTLSAQMDTHEGRRRRESRVVFDREKKRSSYVERDLVKNAVVNEKELDIPACVHDVLGALEWLRARRLEPGQTADIPVSDGKKLVSAKVESLQKETLRTKAGAFNTVKHEAFLFNGVLYGRKGRLFVWISDDDRRLPVQVRVQLPFYVGTITLSLEKFDR
jgi:hypothetical protein